MNFRTAIMLSMMLATLGRSMAVEPASEQIDLQLGPSRDLAVARDGSSCALHITGVHPHFWTEFMPEIEDFDAQPIFEFEYFATEGIQDVHVSMPIALDKRITIYHGSLPVAEAWRPHSIDLRVASVNMYSDGQQRMLFQFGAVPEAQFQIRSMRLRAATLEEQTSESERRRREAAKSEDAEAYLQYLDRMPPVQAETFVVGRDSITLNARFDKASDFDVSTLAIAHLDPHISSHHEIDESWIIDATITVDGDRLVAVIGRYDPTNADRSASRFVVVERSNANKYEPLSAAMYATDWEPGLQRSLEKQVGRDRKGLGIPRILDPNHPIFELGLSHATVNLVVNAIVSDQPRRGWRSWQFEGRDIYLNETSMEQYDRHLQILRHHEIVPSIILLVTNRRDNAGRPVHSLVHPDATSGGLYSMPDLATHEGTFLYRAIVTHLAERFSRAGANTARVSNWIMHNEIDQAGTWTSMGTQPLGRYMETFVRSARLVHHVTRQFDPHSRVFVSLTHHWTKISGGESTYRTRDMIDLMAKASHVEGDFPWGVAYHPYPRNLREPATWNDADVTWDFDTPYITPRNIEVLPAYLDQARLRFQGVHPRAIMFSEQGCNARSLSPEDQHLQAAGIVYLFCRMRHLPSVEAFQYHAYSDNPAAEGGLRLGLITENGKRKAAWSVYQSFNTINETDAVQFAWPIMGDQARSETVHVKPVRLD